MLALIISDNLKGILHDIILHDIILRDILLTNEAARNGVIYHYAFLVYIV